ncbi:MAG: MinD/ParA family protein [Candidatus Binatia bacterium]|nr:MinD/ParA family protein [Candidatus Binatia bacterium]
MNACVDTDNQHHIHQDCSVSPSPTHVFAVTSGKGGVGKTNVVANLAAALALARKRVMVIDADLGLANLDLFLGVTPQYTLADFFAGTRALTDVIIPGRLGIALLPAASGVQEVTSLSGEQKISFLTELDALTHRMDVVLVDTGSGISDTVTYFAAAAQEIIVVVTPEPSALADAYALVKVLVSTHQEKRFWILANNVENEREAARLYDTLSRMALRFLNASLDFLGWIPRDRELVRAVARCQMVMTTAPQSPAARAFMVVAHRLAGAVAAEARVKGCPQFFFRRILAVAGKKGWET